MCGQEVSTSNPDLGPVVRRLINSQHRVKLNLGYFVLVQKYSFSRIINFLCYFYEHPIINLLTKVTLKLNLLFKLLYLKSNFCTNPGLP